LTSSRREHIVYYRRDVESATFGFAELDARFPWLRGAERRQL